jgi:hypothetical protein
MKSIIDQTDEQGFVREQKFPQDARGSRARKRSDGRLLVRLKSCDSSYRKNQMIEKLEQRRIDSNVC